MFVMSPLVNVCYFTISELLLLKHTKKQTINQGYGNTAFYP